MQIGLDVDIASSSHTAGDIMAWIEADVYNHPERWDREDEVDGTWVAWRLVREDEDLDYDNTDSEAYDFDDDY